MAELEVAKHTKNVLEVATSKHHSIWDKARELLLEIVVIVFAVSISIWFHSIGEHRHEQAQVKAFLLGLKQDLGYDISQIEFVRKNYREFGENFSALEKLDANLAAPADFRQRYASASTNVSFNPVMSRYEGFMSSGKLTNIEDPEILKNILFLYQSELPILRTSEIGWRNRHEKLRTYMESDFDPVTGADRSYAHITAPTAKRMLQRLTMPSQLDERLANYAKVAKKIVADIDRAYPRQ